MHLEHPDRTPCLVFANDRGEIKDFPELLMAGQSGRRYFRPALYDLIPLPPGSDLFVLPDRNPIGIDPTTGEPVMPEESPDDPEEGIQTVAAFMAPAYTAVHTAAFEKRNPAADHLPLFAYTAVGWYDGKFWVCGFRSDPDIRQDSSGFPPDRLRKNTLKMLKRHKENRLIQHLGKCCLTYGCPAAKNYFLGRWEAPLPTSPACNANCIGCISFQPSGCCPSTQDRIKFKPTVSEIAGVAVPHLLNAPDPVVSFGQGCEGEPLLQAESIEKAIRLIRKKTDQGTINLNTNASLPEAVERLARAGLDSIRVSLNSARKQFYKQYYRPGGYEFNDVLESISVMKKHAKFVSLNYFIMPGFTDDPEEAEAFAGLIDRYRPDLIQLRNLNIDPDWYFDEMKPISKKEPLGIHNWLNQLKNRFPYLKFGYFNPCLRQGKVQGSEVQGFRG